MVDRRSERAAQGLPTFTPTSVLASATAAAKRTQSSSSMAGKVREPSEKTKSLGELMQALKMTPRPGGVVGRQAKSQKVESQPQKPAQAECATSAADHTQRLEELLGCLPTASEDLDGIKNALDSIDKMPIEVLSD